MNPRRTVAVSALLASCAALACSSSGSAPAGGGNRGGSSGSSSGGSSGSGSGTCSPPTGLPAGSITWSGDLPVGDGGSVGFAPKDVAAIMGGPIASTTFLELRITDYANACGYEQIGSRSQRANSKEFSIILAPLGGAPFPPGVGVYQSTTTSEFSATDPDGGRVAYPISTGYVEYDAQCTGSVGNLLLGGQYPSGSIAITAIDATHVAGTFDLQLGFADFTLGTMLTKEYKGSFDAPICGLPSADTQCCAN